MCTLDGTDAVIHGPLGSGGSIALKERSPREFSATMKVHGEIVSVGYWQISADGHSLTVPYWVPAARTKRPCSCTRSNNEQRQLTKSGDRTH